MNHKFENSFQLLQMCLDVQELRYHISALSMQCLIIKALLVGYGLGSEFFTSADQAAAAFSA